MHRLGAHLGTSVYRKPTHTGRYLDFSSNHPDSAKRAVVRSLTDRSDYISLGETERKNEWEQVKGELQENNYPLDFIVRSQRPWIRPSRQNQETQHAATACIPYVRGLTETISRILSRLNIRTVAKPSKVKWQLMQGAKDKVQPSREAGVIYALGGMECPRVYLSERPPAQLIYVLRNIKLTRGTAD